MRHIRIATRGDRHRGLTLAALLLTLVLLAVLTLACQEDERAESSAAASPTSHAREPQADTSASPALPPDATTDEGVNSILVVDAPDFAGPINCFADAIVKVKDGKVAEVERASSKRVDVGQAVVSSGSLSDTPEGAFPGMPVHYADDGTELLLGWRECWLVPGTEVHTSSGSYVVPEGTRIPAP
jgi:hypothetical protein